jgi:hypothetical protein
MPKVHYLPAFCPVHGLFPSDYTIGGDSTTSYIGNATCCLQCGRVSEVISGDYSSTSAGLNVLLDPSISEEALAAIKGLAERLQKGEISPELAQVEAEQISPKVGRLFDIRNWSDQAQATLATAIIGAASVVIAAKMSSSPNQSVDVTCNPVVIERVVVEPQAKSDKPPAPSTTPIEE